MAEPEIFSHAARYKTQGNAWGFILTGGGFVAASELVGKTVNLGDKNGVVYNKTTVTSFEASMGILRLDGGEFAGGIAGPDPRPVESHYLPIHEIARGFVHE